MYSKLSVNNESESGRLKVVIMHRPGAEILRLTPDNLDKLLFDAIPNLQETHRSHDIFSKYLTKNGVEVLYVGKLLVTALSSGMEACNALIEGIIEDTILDENIQNKDGILNALRQWLKIRTPKQLVDDIIVGVASTKEELGTSIPAQKLYELCHENIEFIIPPLPNLLFTRDAFSIIGKNVFIWEMAKPARYNEPLIYRIIFQYHPILSTSGLKIVEWQTKGENDQRPTIEGGDVAYLGNGVLLIGNGERTNRLGIEALARTDLFQQVIAVSIPPARDYMHLDTVLSSVGKYAFTLHGFIAEQMKVFTVEVYDENRNLYPKAKWMQHGSDIRTGLQELLNHPDLTFYDALDEETSIEEQRDCHHNVLVIDDHHIITYSGGDPVKGIVAQMTRNNECKVGLVPPEGLLEGCGGMHCMTNAVRRYA